MSKTGFAVALLALLLAGLPAAPLVRAQGSFEVAPEARLVESTPRADATLATPPPRLQLVFGGEVDEDQSHVEVYGPTGQRADRRDQQVDGDRMSISLLDLGPGVYGVSWRSALADAGPKMGGRYAFSIQPQLPVGVPQIAVHPPIADNGQPVAVAGSGFAPGGDVVVSVGDGSDLLGVARADGAGRISLEARLPGSLPYGRQVLQATDATDHFATAAVQVPTGGVPVAVVRMLGETDEGNSQNVTYTVRIENRSGYQLSNVRVGIQLPPGTRALLDDAGQPDGSDDPKVSNGEVTWNAHSVAAHAVLGPFTFSVGAPGMPARTELRATAWTTYAHGGPPLFRGRAESPLTRVRLPAPES
jgi:methionine-rich copper-binding protein CopC